MNIFLYDVLYLLSKYIPFIYNNKYMYIDIELTINIVYHMYSILHV